MTTEVHFSRPTLGGEEERAVVEVIRSGWVVGGPRLEQFEQAFAARCGARFAVGASSWTTAAFLVLKCWNIGPGDEVIVPSLTFIATVNAVRHTGATPVFADIEPETWNISPADVQRRITPKTRAIVAVDQLGMPSDLAAFSHIAARHGLLLLDDAACAFGSRIGDTPVGAFGDAAVFSLHARKVITTGEGGMILTRDRALRDRLRCLRHQGMSTTDYARHGARPSVFETYDQIGYNFRMTDMQAAIGLCQLARADDILARRAALAVRYTAALRNTSLVKPPFVPPGVTPNWQSYQVMLRDDALLSRNRLLDELYNRGIHVRRGVMASHLEPAYAGFGQNLPVTERIAARTLQLPLYPQLTFTEQDRVIAALDQIAKG
ncbi:MAG: DegT/DnrJ/EryC1/StrS family aminotransferase [Rhodospirillaceae bacterium]|nr:DegT/DnrJ/EryC1/StrS family aminotransferase [Rhodospirillaceae bacterium]